MIKLLLALFLGLLFVISVEAQYQDVRCKCVCSPLAPQNGTAASKTVFIGQFTESKNCECMNVVKPATLCPRCECKWQHRNTATIKVVVIIIICILSLLVLYMLFLLCLDPLMSRRPKTYLEQHNEEVNLLEDTDGENYQDTQSVTQQRIVEEPSTSRAQRHGVISRVKHEVNRVKGEQAKWKGTVQEQRRNIYDRHTMLN